MKNSSARKCKICIETTAAMLYESLRINEMLVRKQRFITFEKCSLQQVPSTV